jgi:type VI secretion system protein VasD
MNRFVSALFLLLLFVCVSLGAGCAKPRLELAIASQPNVNPDYSGRPSPVIVKVLELRSDVAFKQAEFETLFDTPLQVLGADLLAADELTFIPGEARRIAYQPTPSTRFVGVIAGFRQMDRALWRIVKPVDPEKGNWLSFELNDATILVVPDQNAKDWDPEKAVHDYQQRLTKPQTQNTPAPAAVSGAKQSQKMTPSKRRRPLHAVRKMKARSAPAVVNPASGNTTGKAGVQAASGAKETTTTINENSVETPLRGQDLVSPPASAPPSTGTNAATSPQAVNPPPVSPPPTPNAPTQTLPAMRSL